MKKKHIYSSILLCVILVAYLMLGTCLNHLFGNPANPLDYTHNILLNYYFRYIIYFFYYIVFGTVLGLGHIFAESQKHGKWNLQLGRLLIMGIPMTYIGLYLVFCFIPIPLFRGNLASFFLSNLTITYLAQVAVGYILITSFIKRENIQ